MDDFFNVLEKELSEDIHAILSHQFLQNLKNASLTKEQLQLFATEYCFYCEYFPRFLAAVASNVPDDLTRLPLIKNLWEEHGEGSLNKSHRTLFIRFYNRLGLGEKDRKQTTLSQFTKYYINGMSELCTDTHFLVGLGALGPGTEYFTSNEFELIWSGLQKYDFFAEEDLEFWRVHIEVDDEHYSDLQNSLVPLMNSNENRELVRKGAKEAIRLELSFWDGLKTLILTN